MADDELFKPVVELLDVAIKVGSEGRTLCEDFSLAVPPRSVIGLAGRSGSGKTTLLRLVYGIQQPSDGTVLWGGVNIAQLTERELQHRRRSDFGFANQEILLLDDRTALDNVLLGGATVELAQQHLSSLGLDSLAKKRVKRFSGGERQRVVVARCLAKQPKIALLDEPTAALDEESAQLVIAALRQCADQGGAVLVASHDDLVLEACDQVVRL